jgi:amidase
VGKANLNELAYGATGVNEYFGTPVNPLDPGRVPGGSSSGSAVAVADGDADLAYGSDTGGSIRVPAAFCGITGLKTTHGRIPLAGVWPLAPSMDTVGPMARDVAGVAAGLALLEPGFSVDVAAATRVGRIRPAGLDVDPVIDAAVDAALARCGVEVIDVDLPGWRSARRTCDVITDAEAVVSNQALLADPARHDLLGPARGCVPASPMPGPWHPRNCCRPGPGRNAGAPPWRRQCARPACSRLRRFRSSRRDLRPPSGRAISHSPAP